MSEGSTLHSNYFSVESVTEITLSLTNFHSKAYRKKERENYKNGGLIEKVDNKLCSEVDMLKHILGSSFTL